VFGNSTSATTPCDSVSSRRRSLSQFRYAVGDVGEVAGEDAHVVSQAVDLDARPVQLPFHSGTARSSQRLRHGRGRLGQHRLDRREDRQVVPGQTGDALDHGVGRHRTEVASKHGGASHIGGRKVRRASHRFDHDALQGALAELSRQQSEQEPAFGLRGPLEQPRDQLASRGLRTGAGGGGDLGQRGVHLHQVQGGGRARRGEFAKGRPANADRSLGQAAGQIGDGHGDLLWRQVAEARGEAFDLGEPCACGGHRRRCRGDLLQPHALDGRTRKLSGARSESRGGWK